MDEAKARKLKARILLAIGALVVALVLVEVVLALLGLPSYPVPPVKPAQFAHLAEMDGDVPVHVNLPSSTITFVYSSNPRGYFGASNEVKHITNSGGFRGNEFRTAKPTNVVRIAVLGDSFTFGEGVWFEDTYPEVAATALNQKLRSKGIRVECYNLGVGGYNTRQSLYALQRWGLMAQPDIVVLGYCLNDAEPALFVANPANPQDRLRRKRAYEEVIEPPPAEGLRLARLLKARGAAAKRNEELIEYYRGLYSESQPGWRESQMALAAMAELCRKKGASLHLLCFPMPFRLDRYPFATVNARVRDVCERNGAPFIDLVPALKMHKDSELWVHPADQHPNELAHRIAGETLANHLLYSGVIDRVLKKRNPRNTRKDTKEERTRVAP